MPFLPPNQQCQSAEGSVRPEGVRRMLCKEHCVISSSVSSVTRTVYMSHVIYCLSRFCMLLTLPRSAQSRVYVTAGCLSVCMSHQWTAAAAVSRFAAELPVGRRYPMIAADTVLHAPALRAASCRDPTEEAQHRLATHAEALVPFLSCFPFFVQFIRTCKKSFGEILNGRFLFW